MKQLSIQLCALATVLLLASLATCCETGNPCYPLIEAPTEVSCCVCVAPVLAVECVQVRHVVRHVVVRQRVPVMLHRTIHWERPALIPRLRGVCDVY